MGTNHGNYFQIPKWFQCAAMDENLCSLVSVSPGSLKSKPGSEILASPDPPILCKEWYRKGVGEDTIIQPWYYHQRQQDTCWPQSWEGTGLNCKRYTGKERALRTNIVRLSFSDPLEQNTDCWQEGQERLWIRWVIHPGLPGNFLVEVCLRLFTRWTGYWLVTLDASR